ncbi:MAG: c-type cytochrome [Gammaproteobacteria bacterium]|nr:c-type cytochrome [Gammaproteobacteria bacterium]
MQRGPGSAVRAVAVAVLAAGALATAAAQTPPAPAAAAAQAADPAHGKAVSYTCLGCHGIDGYKNAYPMYSVPELRGQNPQYLVIALEGYRDGDRAHITMHSQTESLSAQDMTDVAAFLAGTPLKSSGKAAGTLPQAAQLCVSCHGQDGIAVAPIYPSLAGQHADYIVRALNEYKHGGRKNAVMKQFAGNLKDEDIAEIAAYFSQLTPSLATEPRPFTRLSE